MRCAGSRAYRKPLDVIGGRDGKQSLEGVVGWQGKAGGVDEELAANVEEDEEEVEHGQTQDDVDLGHAGLLLEVVEGGILGQLPASGSAECAV